MQDNKASWTRRVHEASDLSHQLFTLSQELAKDLRDCEQVLQPLSERCSPDQAQTRNFNSPSAVGNHRLVPPHLVSPSSSSQPGVHDSRGHFGNQTPLLGSRPSSSPHTRSIGGSYSPPEVGQLARRGQHRRRTYDHQALTAMAPKTQTDILPVLCEMEYPLVNDHPVLYLSQLVDTMRPSDIKFQYSPSHCENVNRLAEIFGDEFVKDFTESMMHNDDHDVGEYCKLIFTDPVAMRRAKMLARRSKQALKVTYAKPHAYTRRQSELFIRVIGQLDEEAPDFYLKMAFWRWRWSADAPIAIKFFGDEVRISFPNEEALRESRNRLASLNEAAVKPIFEVTYQPNPYTRHLVICNRTPQIPKELFQKLKFFWPGTESVVEDFEYAVKDATLNDKDLTAKLHQRSNEVPQTPYAQEKGDVFYDITQWESDTQAYARLITQNWWYGTLFWTLVNTTIALMDLYSNFVYAANLFGQDNGAAKYNVDYRYNFLISFFGLEAYIYWTHWQESQKDLKLQMKSAGDLIQARTRGDRMLMRCASFFFYIVQVPCMVKDIIKTLHPFTNVQEKGAAKIYGARIFIIGFPNEHMYRCMDVGAGMQRQFPPIILSRFVLTLFKVVHAYHTRSWASIFLCLTGVVLWPMQMSSFLHLMNDRLALRDHLVQDAKTCDMEIDDMPNLLKQGTSISPKHRVILSIWQRFFPDVTNLCKYRRLRDAFPAPFWIILTILILANLCIVGLTRAGILEVKVPKVSKNVTEASFSVAQHDLDGDGLLSPIELAGALLATGQYPLFDADSRPQATRELALLLQRGLAATAAAKEPLPHWAAYLPSASAEGGEAQISSTASESHTGKSQNIDAHQGEKDASMTDSVQGLTNLMM